MATTPEEFLREGADVCPFSPPLFLDLPPTPTPARSPPRAASPDDLDLDFISRMLMEDDIHDKFFYQYPDHPAILSAQKSLARIISDSNTSTDDDSPNSPSCSDSAADKSTTSDDSATNADKSTTSDDSSTNAGNSTSPVALASPTWPHDPIDLTQLLQYPTTFLNGDVGKKLNPLVNNGTVKESSKQKPLNSPAVDGGQDVLATAFFNGQTDSDMIMFNMAFRKGMEEANKFLPTNNTLLDAISDKPALVRFTTGSQLKNDEADGLGTLVFGNGRGHKKRHNMEDLEAGTGRNSKLMAWEREEIGAREIVDQIMRQEFEICTKGMEDLRVAMRSEAEKNIRKGTGKAARGKRGTASNEVIDLRAMLIHCAQSVASGDRRGSSELLTQIKKHSSPKGDATQRLACCFAEGLEARLAGAGSQVYQSLVAKRTSVVDYLRAYKLYMAASSFKNVKVAFVGKTIMNAMEGKSRLHIVDYNVQYGFQWPGLFKSLAAREGGPPEVRFTGIDHPQPGFRPAFQIEETGRRLSNCARELGLPFEFHGIAAKLETVCAEDLNIDPDEVLVVTSRRGFSELTDESVVMDKRDGSSPRDMVLRNIRKMRPDVFIQSVVNGTYGAPFFVTRFREAMSFFSAQFDILDATIPRSNEERQLIERDIFGRAALNVIACEGADRVDRPETYKQWLVRSHRAGLRQLPLNQEVVKVVMDKAKDHYHKEFVVDVDHRWLLSGWKGRALYAMSAWVAADDDRSKF